MIVPMLREGVGKHPRIFNGHRAALRGGRLHRVRSIADEGDTAAHESKPRINDRQRMAGPGGDLVEQFTRGSSEGLRRRPRVSF